MVTMKFALVSLTLIVLLDAYNARHLHDVSFKRSFGGPSLFYEAVIQMVTGEKLRLPESYRLSSLVHNHQTAYGSVNKPPSKDQETYTRVKSSPPPPIVAPSKGQGTYTRVKSSPPPPIVAPSKGQATYGGVNPLPYVTPSEGQETYGRVNSPPPPSIEASPTIQPFYGEHAKYGRDDPRSPPSPDPNGSQRQGMYDRVNPSAPTATKLVDPTHYPLLSDGAGLSIANEDRWHLLPSYVTRVFKYWG